MRCHQIKTLMNKIKAILFVYNEPIIAYEAVFLMAQMLKE